MSKDRMARGSDAIYCENWPTEGHSYSTHITGGATISIQICDGCNYINWDDIDFQVTRATKDAYERGYSDSADTGYW